MGQTTKAITLTRRAAAIKEKRLGPAHPSYAVTLNNLANLYSANAEYARALILHEQALAIRLKALVRSIQVGMSYSDLASLYGAIADTPRQIVHLKVLGIKRSVHITVGGTDSTTRCGCIRNMGDPNKALPLAARSRSTKKYGRAPARRAGGGRSCCGLRGDGRYARALTLPARARDSRKSLTCTGRCEHP
jgi:tetratricopeptide (TPR) repeat protein